MDPREQQPAGDEEVTYDPEKFEDAAELMMLCSRQNDEGDMDILAECAKYHPEVVDYAGGPGGRTPMHLAAGNGHLDIVKCLIKLRAKPDLQNDEGNTALHWAVLGGHIAVAGLLLKEGKWTVGKKNNAGKTPLMEAAELTYQTTTGAANASSSANGSGSCVASSAELERRQQQRRAMEHLLLRFVADEDEQEVMKPGSVNPADVEALSKSGAAVGDRKQQAASSSGGGVVRIDAEVEEAGEGKSIHVDATNTRSVVDASGLSANLMDIE